MRSKTYRFTSEVEPSSPSAIAEIAERILRGERATLVTTPRHAQEALAKFAALPLAIRRRLSLRIEGGAL